jgi:hypothetical protein
MVPPSLSGFDELGSLWGVLVFLWGVFGVLWFMGGLFVRYFGCNVGLLVVADMILAGSVVLSAEDIND